MKRLLIRPYRLKDVANVIDLWQRCDLTRPWNDPRLDIERKLAVDPDLFLVAELEGVVIGTVMGGYEGHRGWINYLAVESDLQGLGYGRQLMEAVEEMIRARGCPKINLLVRTSNTEVIRFYESIGYTVDDVVGMGKRLVEDSN